MTQDYPLVSTRQYKQESQRWIEAIRHGDNLSILFFRMTDRLRRIQQFLDDYDLGEQPHHDTKKFLFLVLDAVLHNHTIEDAQDLRDHISAQLNYKKILTGKHSFDDWIEYLKNQNVRLVLIMPQAEEYHNVVGHNIMSWLQFLVQEHDQVISTMSFYEVDITHQAHSNLYSDATDLEQRTFYYPLYDEQDTRNFIDYLEDKWQLEVTEKQKNEIIAICGGHFWFVKEALRLLRDQKSWSINQEDMQFRLKTMYNQLLPSEQSVLKKIIQKEDLSTEEEQHSLRYLQKMRVIDSDEKLLLDIFEKFVLNKADDYGDFAIKNGVISLNNVPLTSFFTRKEYRILQMLLERASTIVPRDELAKAIWPTDTMKHYSDWAIDQLMARLKRRLTKLEISPKIITTVRGKGYSIKL